MLSQLSGWKLCSVEGNVPKSPLPAPLVILSLNPATFKEGQEVTAPVIWAGQISGVVGLKIISSKNRKMTEIVYALAQALNKVGIWTDVDLPTPYNNIAEDMITTDAIHIIVGTKP